MKSRNIYLSFYFWALGIGYELIDLFWFHRTDTESVKNRLSREVMILVRELL